MRAKTLLLSAALGVACGATAMAQVYSVNAVGYINVVLQDGFNMMAVQLDDGDSNKVGNVLAGIPDGSIVYKWNNGEYIINSYDELLGGWDDPDMSLDLGAGVWVLVPAGSGPHTVTVVGEVPQGELTTELPAAFTIASSQVPQEGKLATDLGYPVADGDLIYLWSKPDANTGTYVIYSFDELLGGWDPEEPTVMVAEAFWSLKTAAATWTRTFSVNP